MIRRICILFLFIISIFGCIGSELFAQNDDATKVIQAEQMILDGDLSEAFSIYNKLWEDNPSNYDYRLRVGLILGWLKRFSESEDHLVAMLNDYPNNIEIGTALMRVLSWQHRYSESIELSKSFEESYPNNTDLLLITAQSYFWSGAYPDSEYYLEKLLELDDENQVAKNLRKDLMILQAPWIEGGLVYAWDSENTELFIQGLRGQTEISKKSRFQLGVDRFDTSNDWIMRKGEAYLFQGTLFYTRSQLWQVRGDLGLASYQQKAPNRGDLFLSGGFSLRRNTGKHTTNFTLSHNPVLESPGLLENRILLTTALVSYRYRHLNYTFILTPQISRISDGNLRQSALLEFNYSTNGSKFRARPGFKAQYIAFDALVVNNGYFSPERLTTLLASLELDRSEPGGNYQILLAGDIGFQKIKHPVVDSDPKLLYRIDLRFVWSPGDNFRLSTGYEYTNLQTVSAITTSSDYWYQSLHLRIRYNFNRKDRVQR